MNSIIKSAVSLTPNFHVAREPRILPQVQPVRMDQQQQRRDNCDLKRQQQMHPHGGSL
jgi:hypothetical protein